ncbi:energy transducer TonB [Candidatus Magnetomonas plexicatena]|uniref:energy transducer TonB n=1 Tax=Candidatus Magnetomonas plexicatena TaxID=2552947 RepID=UPI001103B906|nr:energy transducer TonB [Nitrospirales bacterium LBB_01]
MNSKYLKIGITASVLFHFVAFLIFAKVTTVKLKNSPKLVINFDIISKPITKPMMESAQNLQQNTAKSTTQKAVKKTVQTTEKSKKEVHAEKISPLDVTSYTDAQQSTAPVASGHTESSATEVLPAQKVSHEETYVKENFTYIRDMVMKRVSYPFSAKKMGISGKVTVSFVVAESGCVEELKVEESSGHGVLDDSAISAVKQAAPFPKPVLSVKIVLPITYRLENG